MIYFRLIIYGFLLLLFPLCIFAQSTKPTIYVKITNQLQEIIENAEVILINQKNEKKEFRISSKGEVRFINVEKGEYCILINAAGFKEYKSEILLIENEFNNFSVVLEIAPLKTNVDVGNDDEADASRFGTTRILSESELKLLPNDPKLLEQVLQNIAGESATGGNLPVTINGFKGNVPPTQAIQQVRISQNIFSAQYAEAYGGGIEIFTKSDVEKTSGNFNFNFADSKFDATDAFLGKRIPSQRRGYSLYLFGPLLKKRISYSLSVTHNDLNTNTAVNAIILDSSLQSFPYKQFFPSPSNYNGIQFSMFHDPTKKQKLYLAYQFSSSRAKGQGIDEFSLPTRSYKSNEQNNILQFSHTFLINENVVNELRFQWLSLDSKKIGENNEMAIDVLDSFSGGGSQINNRIKESVVEFSNNTSWQIGKYELRLGWQLSKRDLSRFSASNFGGTYIFSGKTAPLLDANNNIVYDNVGNLINSQITSLESYRRTLIFQKLGYTNQQIRVLGGGASQFKVAGGNPIIDLSQYELGVYSQNSFKISKSVALSFGLRYENQTNIKSNYNFAPRVGLVWSPKTDTKKNLISSLPKISVGFGIFYSRIELDKIAEIKEINDLGREQYLTFDEEILNLFPSAPSIDLLKSFSQSSIERRFSSDFQTPLQTLYSLNISKKLPRKFSLNTTISYVKSFRQGVTRNVNAPLAGTFNLSTPNKAIYPLGKGTGIVYETLSIGNQERVRFSTTLNFPNTKTFSGAITYVNNYAKNDITNGSSSPTDPYDFGNEFSLSTNVGQSVFFYSSLKLPFGVEIFSNFSYSSGNRFNIITGRDTNGDGFYSERPSFASNLSREGIVFTKYGALDPNPLQTDKIIPRNLGVGPSSFNSSAFLSKTFDFRKRDQGNVSKYNLSVSLSVSNIFNIVNKTTPIGNMSSPNFLQFVSGATNATRNYVGGIQVNSTFGRSFFVTLSYRF